MKKRLRLIELFSGIGAQAKALTNLGIDFEHHRSVEIDGKAVQSYNLVHGTSFSPVSITDINGEDLGVVDTDKYVYMMTYSFPCQDLSNLGLKRGMSKGRGTRSSLLWEVERLLLECETKPQVLVMENVIAVHDKHNYKDFVKWQSRLEEMGYTSYWADMDAKDYGMPQSRGRCFMVSFLTPQSVFFDFPESVPLTKSVWDYIEPNTDDMSYMMNDTTLKAIAQLQEMDVPIGTSLYTMSFDPKPLTEYAHCICARTNASPGKFSGQGNMIVERFDDGTIRIRGLMPVETWQLMGFDRSDYEKVRGTLTDTQLNYQAGNSIVVPVLEQLFGAIIHHLGENDGVEILTK